MKSFKEFLESKKVNEGSMLDIAKKTLGSVTFTPEEESELSNLYSIVKDCVSKNPIMFQSFLSRMSKGNVEMERLLNSVDMNALRRASRKEVKGLDYVENSAMDVLRGVVGTTSYSDLEENELVNLFTLVMHAIDKNPMMVRSYLERMTKGDEESEKLVGQMNPIVLKRASKKALSKMGQDHEKNEEMPDDVDVE